MWQIPDDLASFLKDGLRGARYVVRHGTARARPPFALPPGVPGFARLADTVLTATEQTASVLLQRNRLDFTAPADVLAAFGALVAATDAVRRRRAFVHLHYRLIESVARRLGADNAYISEHEIALAYERFRTRHGRMLSGPRQARTDPLRVWAAAAAALAQRAALCEIDPPQHGGPHAACLEQAPVAYALLVAALAGATLTTRAGAGAGAGSDTLDRYIDSAAAVVTARFAPLLAALAAPDAADALAAAFAPVLPFLP